MLPVPYMAVQGVGGFDDNLQMGLNFKWNIAKGLVWTGDVFVDDLNMNSILKFDFDTMPRHTMILTRFFLLFLFNPLIFYPNNSIMNT